ncbi:PREDICTED: cysteine-rich [Prunus dulcis]|uniref:PREDICTED: cysteine-rich n=1 Tax=Prunus dulcis TaxID=3755 RepID=A0A5E4GBB0_PRUDU|nr:PREDICTED: cysteine-rich [Prunus dulcis]
MGDGIPNRCYFTSDGNSYGFYNSSYGGENSNDQIYATGLCRGDIATDAYRRCLNDSTFELRRLCPNQKEALGFYDNCMLRCSNESIYGIMQTRPLLYFMSMNNISTSKCSPDLSEQVCNECLVGAFGDILQCCCGREGGRVLNPSCTVRYESARFYDPTTVAPLPSPPIAMSSPPPSTNT